MEAIDPRIPVRLNSDGYSGSVRFLTLAIPNDTTLRLQGQFVATRPSPVQAPVMQLRLVSEQTISLNWQRSPDLNFQVQSSTNLVTWRTNAVNVTSGSTNYTWAGPTTAPCQFFRVTR